MPTSQTPKPTSATCQILDRNPFGVLPRSHSPAHGANVNRMGARAHPGWSAWHCLQSRRTSLLPWRRIVVDVDGMTRLRHPVGEISLQRARCPQLFGAVAGGRVIGLQQDPYEKFDMTFNGAISYRLASSSPGRYAGQDNGWALALIYPALIDFAKSISNIQASAASPVRHRMTCPQSAGPSKPVSAMDPKNPPRIGASGG
jgi:hypothetical protein